MADVARGERIQELRKEKRITQDDMPWKLREFNGNTHVISRRGYQLWEAGEGISWKRAKILAEFFQVPVEEVAERVEDKTNGVIPLRVLNGAPTAEQLDRIEEKLDEILKRLSPPGEGETGAPQRSDDLPPPPSFDPSSPATAEPEKQPARRRRST